MAMQDEIARWMYEEVKRHGKLSRRDATSEIYTRFGPEWIYITESGGRGLDRRILKAFEKLTKTKVVFVKPEVYSEMYWRLRKPGDKPGRQQIEVFEW